MIQAILVQDRDYEKSVRTVDFIKRYIFPGSFIPSTTAIVDAATGAERWRHFAEGPVRLAPGFRGMGNRS